MNSPMPPTLAELSARFLGNLTAEVNLSTQAQPDGEVAPHQNGTAVAIDARQAWEDATLAARLGRPTSWKQPSAPAGWETLVNQAEALWGVPLCVGDFPGLIRDVQPFLSREALTPPHPSGLRVAVDIPAGHPSDFPGALVQLGVLRLANQFEDADALVTRVGKAPSEWSAVWNNELAALDWHRGQADAALASWLEQKESVAVLFNRGMAHLFLGKEGGRDSLRLAAAQLPETGAWHHLAQLYLSYNRPER